MLTTYWLAERIRDLAMWPVNLLRDFPGRSARLFRILRRRGSLAGKLHALACALFDLVGGPEIAQFVMHLGMHTTPLTAPEIQAITSVLGPHALRYSDVRIAAGGILPFIFRHNGGRAFATWHTIHLPQTGRHTRANLSLLVHEATHVFQYERIGTAYIGEALHAQRRAGREAYHYGGMSGLHKSRRGGRRYCEFNREAQAQIAQDYFARCAAGQDVSAYEPFIAELRSGAF